MSRSECCKSEIDCRGLPALAITPGDADLKPATPPRPDASFRSGLKTSARLDPKGEPVSSSLNHAAAATKVGHALMVEGKYADALNYYQEGSALSDRLL